MKKFLVIPAFLALAIAGAGATELLPSDEHVVCASATATVAPRTVGVDETPVYTIPGASDIQTHCETFTDQTITVTTTVAPPPPPPPPIPPPPVPPPPPTIFSSNAGIYPPGTWRPYAATSPFNRGVPANPPFVANSAGIVSRILGFSPRISNMTAGLPRAQDYEHPTYWSDPTDPLYTIHCVQPWGRCSIEGRQVRIPNRAFAPPTSNDGHMTVVEQWNNDEIDMYEAQTPLSQNGGPLNIGWGGSTSLAGDGLGTGEAVAAEWGNLAGIMRAQEAISGTINHALFLVLTCGSNNPQFVYPATKGGAFCSSQTNAPPMGSHLWLDLTEAEIDALVIPAWQKMILKALHNYGAFMGDTGGPGFALQFESPLTYTSFPGSNTQGCPTSSPCRPDPLVNWAATNGWSLYQGYRVGNWSNVPSSVWTHLHILDPCVSKGNCQ